MKLITEVSIMNGIIKNSIIFIILLLICFAVSFTLISNLSLYFFNPKQPSVINIYHTDNKNKLIIELDTKITKEIESYITDRFSQTVSVLNHQITLFSSIMTLLLVVFGVFSFKKMSEIENLSRELQNTPEKVVKKYAEKQLQQILLDLDTDDYIIKNKSINALVYNQELNETHYNRIKNVLSAEVYAPSPFLFENCNNLINTLLRINYDKGISYCFELLSEGGLDYNFSVRIMEIIICSPYDKHIQDLIEFLTFNKSHYYEGLFFDIITEYKKLTLDTVLNILRKDSSPNTLATILHKINRDNSFDYNLMITKCLESNIDIYSVEKIVSWRDLFLNKFISPSNYAEIIMLNFKSTNNSNLIIREMNEVYSFFNKNRDNVDFSKIEELGKALKNKNLKIDINVFKEYRNGSLIPDTADFFKKYELLSEE